MSSPIRKMRSSRSISSWRPCVMASISVIVFTSGAAAGGAVVGSMVFIEVISPLSA
jgi:hypothetical protein